MSDKMVQYYTSDFQLNLKSKGNQFDVWTSNSYENGDICVYVYEKDFIKKNEYRGTLPSDSVIDVRGKHR